MSSKKRCPFCAKTAPEIHFTNEHILRNKFNKLFIESPNALIWENRTTTESGQKNARTVSVPHGPFDSKINSICNECNSGWMNSLEANAENHLVELFYAKNTPSCAIVAETIAFWAVKTAAVYALKHRDKLPGFPNEHYPYLRNKLKPPPHTHVWFCKSEFNADTHLRYNRAGIEGDRTSAFYLSTINIGNAVLSVLGASNEKMHAALELEIEARDKLFTKLWPNSGEIVERNIVINNKAELMDIGVMLTMSTFTNEPLVP